MYTIQNITQITRNVSLSFTEVESLLKSMSIIFKSEIGYWCASKPEIQTQPQEELIVPLRNRFSSQCEANSSLPLTYRWKKNDHTLSTTKGTLIFDNAKVSDIGIYHCEASNAVGTSLSNQATVTVYEAPYSSFMMGSINTFAGADSVQFVCPITGYPEQEFSWYFKPDGMNFWIKLYNETASSLVISELNFRDCTNVMGVTSMEIPHQMKPILTVFQSRYVEINYKFKSMWVLSDKTINASENDNIILRNELL